MLKLILFGLLSTTISIYTIDIHLLKKTDTAALFKAEEVLVELRNNQNILDTNLPVSAIVNAANEGVA